MEITINDDGSKLLPALLSVQRELMPIQNSRENSFAKYKYLELSVALAVVKPLLSAHKLVMLQSVDDAENAVAVTTAIYHVETGECVKCTKSADLTEVKATNKTQQMGATISYLRRYQITALLNFCGTDDDIDAYHPVAERETPRDTEVADAREQLLTRIRESHKLTPTQKKRYHEEANDATSGEELRGLYKRIKQTVSESESSDEAGAEQAFDDEPEIKLFVADGETDDTADIAEDV